MPMLHICHANIHFFFHISKGLHTSCFLIFFKTITSCTRKNVLPNVSEGRMSISQFVE